MREDARRKMVYEQITWKRARRENISFLFFSAARRLPDAAALSTHSVRGKFFKGLCVCVCVYMWLCVLFVGSMDKQFGWALHCEQPHAIRIHVESLIYTITHTERQQPRQWINIKIYNRKKWSAYDFTQTKQCAHTQQPFRFIKNITATLS